MQMFLVFEQVRDDNNKLWKQVKYVREAVLDGDNLEMISTVHGQFDWDLLGREVGCCFNAIPGNVTFFSGPIAGEYKPKERKQRAPRSKDEEEVSYQLMLIINKLLRSV